MFYDNDNLDDKIDKETLELNGFSIVFNEVENFLPIPYDILTEYNEKNEILENEDKTIINYTIPNEPCIFPEKEINHKMSLLAPNEEIKLSEKIINNVKNSTTTDELKFVENTENTNIKIEEEVLKTLLTNKRKIINKKGDKNIFNPVNIIRKSKHLPLYSIFNHINNKLKEFYNNDIRIGIFKKQILSLNQKQKSNSNITFNKEFLNKTLKEIFSTDISGKYSNYDKDYNKKLIESLLNEKDVIIKDYFTKLFNLKFTQCLEHYMGTQFYLELKGMRLFEEENYSFMDNEEYVKNLKYHLNNYESIIKKKKSRRRKKKDDSEI